MYVSESGSCVQYKVCSYESKTQSTQCSGSHSYISATKDNNHMNFVIESSISQNTGFNGALNHAYGTFQFSSINISDSKLDWNTAFVIWEPSSLSITNYSNFKNLSSYSKSCFLLHANAHNFYLCNVIDNKVSASGAGIFCIESSATLSVIQCFFKGNKATKLFNIYSGSATANECHFELGNTFEKNGNQSPKSMTEIILSNLYYPYLCEVIVRNKKTTIIFPKIPISNLISDQPSIPSK